MVNVHEISLSKKLGIAMLGMLIAFTSLVSFAPKASAAGSTPGYYYTVNCRTTDVRNYRVDRTTTTANQSFSVGRFCLASTSGRFIAIFQTDGNFVLYDNGRPIWASGTNGRGATRLTLQNDGNIVIYNARTQPLWSSNTWGIYNSTNQNTLVMQNDGNLVLYQGGVNFLGRAIWATGTNR